MYDRTVAADYDRAMRQIEGAPEGPVSGAELLALVDALAAGTLDEAQQEAVQVLRDTILALDSGAEPIESNGSAA